LFIHNDEITKEMILKEAVDYCNPSKTNEWQRQGIDLVMAQRSGYFFHDMNGKKYRDLHLNGGTFNLGHRNKEIIAALIKGSEELDIGNHHFPSITKSLLAKKMNDLTPDPLRYSIFSTGGGEAVDVAIKSARYATQRPKIISISGCYHGHTGLALATGDPMFKDPFLCQGHPDEFKQVPFEDLDAMESELKHRNVAAVIMETIPATYGFPIPRKGYLKAVKELCEKYDSLYIADEVQTGLMRTGKLWGFEHEGFVPDIMVSAKGFGGGIYPIAVTVCTPLAGQWLQKIGRLHGSTCGGADLGCAVALKVLEITTRKPTVANVLFLQDYIRKGLDVIQKQYADFFSHIRQRGVIFGLAFNEDEGAKKVMRYLYQEGVWAIYSRLNPKILQFKVGLLCDKDFCDDVLARTEQGIKRARENRL
jgi:acetylornithine/succinyldiaminopimelate/putrescine aminotransferase